MDEIISHKMCAVKVRNAKLRNYLKAGFPLGGILRAERNFSLSCDFSGGTN
jgi:hypothetical protein